MFLIGMFCLSTMLFPIAASAQNCPPAAAAQASGIQPYSNQTGYKYKTVNGRLYKRLWSYTYNRWEEPNWSPA